MGSRWPDHCCFCGLRPGAIVIGGFVIAVCLPLMTFMGKYSSQLDIDNEKHTDDSFYLAVALYKLNAALCGLEVVFTIGLFWGIYKRREKWVMRWLFVSAGWWTTLSVFSWAIYMSGSHYIPLLCTSFISPFIFFLGLRAMKTVAGLRDEMRKEDDLESQQYLYPSSLAAAGAGADADANPTTDPNANANATASAEDNVQL
ncbi:hypothetical protein R5R35_010263 [Gryllus longicercus]|uniref:Uncharacterized protein n=1 Tax=Gryllus longicercus TaxID=2509291 RepID=A0AAN9V0L8_9ORTH